MNGKIRFELVTLDGTKFAEEVYEVILPTSEGYIGILPSHIPLVSLAAPGVISVRRNQGDRDDQMDFFATNGGAIEVLDNVVRVLVDEADHEAEINEQEAQKAFERAQQLRAEASDQVTLEKAQELIDRQQVRLQVAGLRRRKRR
ncbi:MAG TPA: ATP synthase F1 subunit epsilon [Patescibacteria group bacterium]|nr:ATP synthase F1 subunit epsilon [Patescibacteria group bacterium]